MNEATRPDHEEATRRLTELVLHHLGIPRPGASKHIQELQDRLLPVFMQTSRQAWLAASPMVLPNDPVYGYLQSATEGRSADIRELNNILEEMGVHDLLGDVASSADVAMLNSLTVDPYEERLLRAAGHPSPGNAMAKLLRAAAAHPEFLASSRAKLEEGAEMSLKAHRDINIILNLQDPQPNVVPPGAAAAPPAAAPPRRKLFAGLGALFSGLVLLSGNSMAIPTVVFGNVGAIPVLTSLAGGIAGVGLGIGQLRGEG